MDNSGIQKANWIRGAEQFGSEGGIKIKNKAKNKAAANTKKENQTKNKGKKEWKQR